MNSTSNIDCEIPHDRSLRLQALGLDPLKLDHLLGLSWVRPAQRDDAVSLSSIYNETALSGSNSATSKLMTVAEMEQQIDIRREGDWPIWLCLSRQTVAAFVSLQPFCWASGVSFETAEHSMYIATDWRGIGLGEALFALAPVLAERRGCHNIVSWILANNSASLKLFGKSYTQWAYFPSLARSAGQLRDVRVLGIELERWFATSRGIEARRQQIVADAQMSVPLGATSILSTESSQGVSQ